MRFVLWNVSVFLSFTICFLWYSVLVYVKYKAVDKEYACGDLKKIFFIQHIPYILIDLFGTNCYGFAFTTNGKCAI